MHVISPPIMLDHENDLRGIWLFRDWIVDLEGGLVTYRPALMTFIIECPAPPPGRAPLVTGIVARLVHVCDGTAIPPPDQLQHIGKDAIHAFIIESPMFAMPDVEDMIPF